MSEQSAPPPLSSRVVDGFSYGFAAWTLLTNVTVFLGGNLQQLVAVAGASAALATGVSIWAKRPSKTPDPLDDGRSRCPSETLPEGKVSQLVGTRRSSATALAAALLIAGLYFASGNLELFWWCAVAFLLTLAWAEVRAAPALPTEAEKPRETKESKQSARPRWEILLFVVAVGCTAVTLFSHRIAYDDVFYLNMAVTAVDHPGAPLLAMDGLHGIPSLPMLIAIYRVHSIELLGAAVSFLSGRSVLDATHLLIPAIAAFLVPLALARAYRLIVPGRWIWAVLTAVGIYLFVGESHHWYSNFAFVRLHEGKGMFLCLSVPLIISYALEFSSRPTRLGWLRLACAQVGAIGLSSTALLVAPAVAGLALVAGSSPSWRSLRTLLIGLSASTYGLVLAAMLMSETRETMSALPGAEHANVFDGAVAMVLGGGAIQFLTLGGVLATWGAASSAHMRRLGVVFPLGFFMILFNPYSADWIAENAMSTLTYWRVFWVLPIPLLLGAVLTAPVDALQNSVPRWIGGAVSGLLVSAFLFWAPSVPTLSRANEVSLRAPGWKVPQEAFAAASAMVANAPPDSFALAPYQVAHWVPTQRHHPPLIAIRRHYLKLINHRVEGEKIGLRLQLFDLLSASRPISRPGDVARALSQFPIGVVCLDRLAGVTKSFTKLLDSHGFQLVETSKRYAVWARAGGESGPN